MWGDTIITRMHLQEGGRSRVLSVGIRQCEVRRLSMAEGRVAFWPPKNSHGERLRLRVRVYERRINLIS